MTVRCGSRTLGFVLILGSQGGPGWGGGAESLRSVLTGVADGGDFWGEKDRPV